MSAETPTPLLYLVKRVELAVRKHLDAVLEPHGLTTIQYTALTTLARHDGMTAAALARYSFVAPQTMAQLVGVLESRGWIARSPDPAFRRRLVLTLTDAGRRLLDELRSAVAEVEARMTADAAAADLAKARTALRTFATALEPGGASADDEPGEPAAPDARPADGPPRTRQGSPASLLLTLFGDYWYDRAEPLPSAALVSLLGDFGVSEAAARATLSRMVKHGLLMASRAGRNTGYRPTARTVGMLGDAVRRIVAFDGEEHDWDGSWHVVIVDDSGLARPLREAIRSRLEWLGFARLLDGVWLSPWDRHRAALEELTTLGVDEVSTLVARVSDEVPGRRRPEQAWDLVELGREYRSFVAESLRLQEALAAGHIAPAEALVHRTGLTDEWLALTNSDPDLPARLLPADWPRAEAREVFIATHEALGERAIARVVEAVSAVDPTLADLVMRRSFRHRVSPGH